MGAIAFLLSVLWIGGSITVDNAKRQKVLDEYRAKKAKDEEEEKEE